jgi:hypothetical protein
MAKRSWKVEWRSQPRSDGLERLGQAVKLAIAHGALAPNTRQTKTDEQPRLAEQASGDAREELDA